MRWCGTRSAYTDMSNLSSAWPTSSVSATYLSLLLSFASISSLIGPVLIIFVSIKAVYVLSISYSILFYFGFSCSPGFYFFSFGTTHFCHSSTLTYAYTPSSSSLVRSTPFPLVLPPFLRKFRLFLALLPRRCLPPHVSLVSRPRV
jgi:hypothetical protein